MFYRKFGHHKNDSVDREVTSIYNYYKCIFLFTSLCVHIYFKYIFFNTIKALKTFKSYQTDSMKSFIYKYLLVEKRNVRHPDFVWDKLYSRYSSKVIWVPYKEFISPSLWKQTSLNKKSLLFDFTYVHGLTGPFKLGRGGGVTVRKNYAMPEIAVKKQKRS